MSDFDVYFEQISMGNLIYDVVKFYSFRKCVDMMNKMDIAVELYPNPGNSENRHTNWDTFLNSLYLKPIQISFWLSINIDSKFIPNRSFSSILILDIEIYLRIRTRGPQSRNSYSRSE